MSFSFPDPPEAVLHFTARVLYAIVSSAASNNATLDDEAIVVDGSSSSTGGSGSTNPTDGFLGNQLNDDLLQDSSSDENKNDDTNPRDRYEFVAFLLWYTFLVICCVLPTCCAYRRRRLVEARMEQQQASFERLQQQSFFILSHLRAAEQQGTMDADAIKAERTRRITEELQSTTFTVEAKDLSENVEIDLESGQKIAGSDDDNDNDNDNKDEHKMTGEGIDAVAATTTTTAVNIDEELGVVIDVANEEAMDNTLLTLPLEAMGSTPDNRRTVPGGCAICLCPYEAGDSVTWSRKESCRHCFHSECVIPWLAKKNEPKCPCCRQDFCTIEPLPEEQLLFASNNNPRLSILTPFGLIPHAIATPVVRQTPFFMRGHGTPEFRLTAPGASSSSDRNRTTFSQIDLSLPFQVPPRSSMMMVASNSNNAGTPVSIEATMLDEGGEHDASSSGSSTTSHNEGSEEDDDEDHSSSQEADEHSFDGDGSGQPEEERRTQDDSSPSTTATPPASSPSENIEESSTAAGSTGTGSEASLVD